ncbi:CheY-like chemotaxis protein [Rhizobium leguminosarum]|uniref:CheY-like chemotaxis protein n=1 Tax=Rhizobium leguminosarum TaxID=384 RepID=A0A7Z0IZW2_RHILE|nr:metallophosphoesterase [Rhizobium leguminosarum]NYJ13039.1 CheY-like chemotaxis protein [Rhizobium leguminosarum]
MRTNILIVDDEILDGDTRFDDYNEVREALEAAIPSFKFEFHFAESGADAIVKLSSLTFDFIILDVVLEDQWMRGAKHQDLLDRIAAAAPFALLTSRFDDSSHEMTSSILSKGRCQCFMSWSDFKAFARHPMPLFSLMTKSSHNLVGLDAALKLGPDEPVSILHISDIQSGGYPSKDDTVEIQMIANSILDACGGRAPTFVVSSGDLSEKGLPEEFAGGITWIRELGKCLGFPDLPTSRCLSVPGNHDFCWPLASAASWDLAPTPDLRGKKPSFQDTVLHPQLTEFAFAPYSEAQSKLTESKKYIGHAGHRINTLNWVDASFSHIGIVFYGLNSVWPITSSALPGKSLDEHVVGKVGEELTVMRRTIDKSLGFPPYVIGIVHHSPFGDIGDRSIDNSDFFKKFLIGAGKTDLLMFGHVHESTIREVELSDRSKVIYSCASTVTKRGSARPEDTNRGLNLIELARSKGQVVKSSITTFEWRSGQLVPNKPVVYTRR